MEGARAKQRYDVANEFLSTAKMAFDKGHLMARISVVTLPPLDNVSWRHE